MSLPKHIADHLAALGLANPDGIGLAARPRPCRRCNAPTLVGLTGHILASPAHVDAVETDELGEAIALALGRSTFHLLADHHPERGPYWTLRDRNLAHFAARTPRPLFVEHLCGHPPPPPTAATRFPPPPPQRHRTAEPDY